MLTFCTLHCLDVLSAQNGIYGGGGEAEVYSETVGSYEDRGLVYPAQPGDSGTERVSFGDMAVIPAQVIGGDRVT